MIGLTAAGTRPGRCLGQTPISLPRSLQVAIGEEFLYCVKAAGFAAAGAASGRAGGLRPVPPSAPPSPCQRPQYGREVSSPSSPMATCPCG